jgi:hypothetical protein
MRNVDIIIIAGQLPSPENFSGSNNALSGPGLYTADALCPQNPKYLLANRDMATTREQKTLAHILNRNRAAADPEQTLT